jgi:hypothetical protein
MLIPLYQNRYMKTLKSQHGTEAVHGGAISLVSRVAFQKGQPVCDLGNKIAVELKEARSFTASSVSGGGILGSGGNDTITTCYPVFIWLSMKRIDNPDNRQP